MKDEFEQANAAHKRLLNHPSECSDWSHGVTVPRDAALLHVAHRPRLCPEHDQGHRVTFDTMSPEFDVVALEPQLETCGTINGDDVIFAADRQRYQRAPCQLLHAHLRRSAQCARSCHSEAC